MSLDLPKAYEANTVEADVYRRWEESGCFKAGAGRRDGKPTYTIAIPPPNVTGVLHMGHALNNTLQDTLIRWKRMQGFDTLWQPGTDHAGIATESVVAKRIQEDAAFLKDLADAGITAEQAPDPAATATPTGLDRDRFGREGFLKAVWFWKERSGGQIVHQLRKLGSSCDWSRERFTMDAGLSAAVREIFVRLYKANLIYRGTRMVNWCPVQQTALSDDEVEHIEKQGHLWKLKYDLADGSGSITVETTRPETMFGDTAVAVNPEDPRYKHLIGKMVKLPVIGREIPIVGDEHADPEKGSGAVKITPAHDPNDYEVGQRQGLPLVRCLGLDGKMTSEAGPYAGLDRFACRKQLLKDLEAQGVLLGATQITHSVGHSYRSNAPIEPMVTDQWFVKMAPLAERAVAETRAGRLHFHPERWTKVYEHWLTNVRDWCISRQIWWGHRIPAWHCAACGKISVSRDDLTTCTHCGSAEVRQDSDVLDTWFSSALWPYSTLGWPDWQSEARGVEGGDDSRSAGTMAASHPARSDQVPPSAKSYFPTSTLVTDRGIIFFWVARMVMTSLFVNDVRPFDDVYIHGTVLDERGVKMSKSLGNGIDPIVMIEGGKQEYLKKVYDCPGYGADAVRYTLLDMTTEGQDLKLSPAKFETGRNFANKVWNAGRFLLQQIGSIGQVALLNEDELTRRVDFTGSAKYTISNDERPSGSTAPWILARLQYAISSCTAALENWRFNDYVNAAYRFFRDDLCDWYLEYTKAVLKGNNPQQRLIAASVLYHCFERGLRLLHPGMPFITEHLWQLLRQTTDQGSRSDNHHLMLTEWPMLNQVMFSNFDEMNSRMEILQGIVVAVRNIRNQQQLKDAQPLDIVIVVPNDNLKVMIEFDRDFLIDRGNLSGLSITTDTTRPPQSVTAVVGALKVHVSMQGHVDPDKFKAQYEKRKSQLEKSISGKQGRLANPDYIARAPADQVAETRAMLAAEEAELGNVVETLAGL